MKCTFYIVRAQSVVRREVPGFLEVLQPVGIYELLLFGGNRMVDVRVPVCIELGAMHTESKHSPNAHDEERLRLLLQFVHQRIKSCSLCS